MWPPASEKVAQPGPRPHPRTTGRKWQRVRQHPGPSATLRQGAGAGVVFAGNRPPLDGWSWPEAGISGRGTRGRHTVR